MKYTYRVDRKDKAPEANNVFVVIHGSEKDSNPGMIMTYAPIGQHGEASLEYLRHNTKKITADQYREASKGLYTPEEYLPLPDTIQVSWHIDDIKEQDSSLTKQQCREILQMLDRGHDATIGINWDVIDCTIDEYKQEKGI